MDDHEAYYLPFIEYQRMEHERMRRANPDRLHWLWHA